VLLVFGQRILRPWLHLVAGHKTSELFMLNVLLVTLGLAYLTDLAGLSLALGAFLAGILISETEYRYQVKPTSNPFAICCSVCSSSPSACCSTCARWLTLCLGNGAAFLLVLGKALMIGLLSRFSGSELSVSIRSGLALAQGGEFGLYCCLWLAGYISWMSAYCRFASLRCCFRCWQRLSFIHYSEAIVQKVCAVNGEPCRELHEVAVRSASSDQHVIVCGYGRSGQNLARFLEQEKHFVYRA